VEPAIFTALGAILAKTDPAIYSAAAAICVALISGAVAVRATLQAKHLAQLNRELDKQAKLFDRKLDAEDLLKKYSEPLAGAAFDLQSRCWNIVSNDPKFFQKFGSHHERFPDAVMTTLFRFAQYFGWAEILRSEIQYLSFPDKDGDTRAVSKLLGEIGGCVASSEDDQSFMIWVDEQRAIGERMIVDHPNGPRCMGYAAFCDNYDACFTQLFERVIHDIAAPASEPRLGRAQNMLCDLVGALDPEGRRYDKEGMKRAPGDRELVAS
jgi:hypothetical protein